MKKLLLFLTFNIMCALLLVCCRNQNSSEGTFQTGENGSRLNNSATIAEGSIVYVELDSLTSNYLMTADLLGELEEKMNRLEADLNNRRRVFQSNINDFRNRAERGLETRARLAEIEQSLMNEEQNLAQLVERYQMEMAEEQAVMQRQILQSIMDYLHEYNQDKGYKYILGNAFDAKILYADPSLNITAPVLEGINAKYRAERR